MKIVLVSRIFDNEKDILYFQKMFENPAAAVKTS